MKKEKKVRQYTRKTKSGKTVIVKAHTVKYDAVDKAKEIAKKKGAGEELEERKKKKPIQLEIPFDKEEEKKVLDEVKGVEVSKMTGASLTRDAKLPKGITVKGSWRKISDAGTKGIGHSSWSSKADVFEATLSDGRKVTLHRTYGPAGETKVSYSSGESAKKVRPVGSGTNGPAPKEKKSAKKATKTSDSKSASEPAFTAAEFKEWYRGTGSAADKKVAKALRAQLGRSGYRKLEDEAIDNYSSRGHLSMFKRVSGGSEVSAKTQSSPSKATASKGTPKKPKTSAEKAEPKTKARKGSTTSDSEVSKRLQDYINKHYTKTKGGTYKSIYKWDKKSYTEQDLHRKHNKDIAYEYRLEKDPKFAASEAVKGAKAELRGYGKQTPASISRQYGKDSKEYKGYMKLYSTPVPKDPKKAAVRNAVLQGFGRAGDDTCRDLLVANGYPHTHAYSKGVKEISALAKKYGIDW